MSSKQRLARELLDTRRLALGHATTPQLSSSSIDGGGLGFRDPDGNDLGSIGIGDDGGFVIDYTGGPKPPKPSPPTVSADAGLFRIEWDGSFENAGDSGVLATSDTDRVEIHASMDENFVPDRVESFGGAFATIDGGSFTLGPLPEAGTYYFRLVARSKSAQFSEPSERVEQELAITSIDLAVTDAWLTGDAAQVTADGKNGIWRGPDQPVEDPDVPFKDGDIWFEMTEDGKSIPNIWDDTLGQWVGNDDYRQSEIEKVQAELREDLDSIVVDGSGTTNYYQGTPPSPSSSPPPKEGDLWFDNSDKNKPHIFQDGGWVTVRDSYIENEAVTTEKLAVGAITAESGIIGSINAGTITVGEMNGARIKAQTIAADKLLIGGIAPLNTNPEFSDGLTGWTSTGSPTVSGSVVTLPRDTSISSAALAVTPGQVLRVRAITSGGDVFSTGVGLFVHNATPSNPNGNVFIGFNSGNTGQVPGSVIGDHRVTIPAGWTHVRIAAEKSNAGSPAAVYSLGAYNAAGATLIQDGSIVTEHIRVGAITAESGIIGSIDANVITVGKIMANQLDADAINGKTITGATIRTASSGSRVELTHNGLKQYNSLGATIVDMTAGSFSVAGGSITGSTIKTAASGSRVEITSQGLKQFGPSGSTIAEMTAGSMLLSGDFAVDQGRILLRGDQTDAQEGRGLFELRSGSWYGGNDDDFRGPGMYFSDPDGGDSGQATIRSRNFAGQPSLEMEGFPTTVSSTVSTYASVSLNRDSASFGVKRRTKTSGGWSRSFESVFTAFEVGVANITGRTDTSIWGGGAHVLLTGTGSSSRVQSSTIWNTTGVNDAPVYINQGTGSLGRNTSSRRYKQDIKSAEAMPSVLDIETRRWRDRAAVAQYQEALGYIESIGQGPLPRELAESPDEPGFQFGAIAEEVDELGLSDLVLYDQFGRPDALHYDKFGVALIPIVRGLRDRIEQLETQLASA